MAETLVEKQVCDACGSEVRGGSSFCYNCGESLVEEPAPPAILKPDSVQLNGRDIRNAKTEAFREPEPPPVAIPRGSPHSPPKPAAKTETFPAAAAEPARRQPRTRAKKVVEIEWAERTSSSIGFVIAAIAFAVLAVVLVIAALALR